MKVNILISESASTTRAFKAKLAELGSLLFESDNKLIRELKVTKPFVKTIDGLAYAIRLARKSHVAQNKVEELATLLGVNPAHITSAVDKTGYCLHFSSGAATKAIATLKRMAKAKSVGAPAKKSKTADFGWNVAIQQMTRQKENIVQDKGLEVAAKCKLAFADRIDKLVAKNTKTHDVRSFSMEVVDYPQMTSTVGTDEVYITVKLKLDQKSRPSQGRPVKKEFK
jgi:hypothetical protein